MPFKDTQTRTGELEKMRERWTPGHRPKPKRKRSIKRISESASAEVARHLALRLQARHFCDRNCDNTQGIHHYQCLITLWTDDAGRLLIPA